MRDPYCLECYHHFRTIDWRCEHFDHGYSRWWRFHQWVQGLRRPPEGL